MWMGAVSAALASSSSLSLALGQRKAMLERRARLVDVDAEWSRIFGIDIVRISPDPSPKCDYCGLRGHGVRCDGCGAPKP